MPLNVVGKSMAKLFQHVGPSTSVRTTWDSAMIISVLCFGGGIVLGSHFSERILPVYKSALGKTYEVWYSTVLKSAPPTQPMGNMY
eukprot:s735_g2.t1